QVDNRSPSGVSVLSSRGHNGRRVALGLGSPLEARPDITKELQSQNLLYFTHAGRNGSHRGIHGVHRRIVRPLLALGESGGGQDRQRSSHKKRQQPKALYNFSLKIKFFPEIGFFGIKSALEGVEGLTGAKKPGSEKFRAEFNPPNYG